MDARRKNWTTTYNSLEHMGSLIINIRFWYWHLKIGKRFSTMSIERNDHHVTTGLKGKKKIQVYKFF